MTRLRCLLSMHRWGPLLLAASALALSACGGGAGGGGSADGSPTKATSTAKTSDSVTPSEATTSVPPIRVGLKATCELIFSGRDSLFHRAFALAQKKHYEYSDITRAQHIARDWRSVQDRAVMSLEPYIGSVADTIRQLSDQLSQNRGTLSVEDLRASGLEIVSKCQGYIE